LLDKDGTLHLLDFGSTGILDARSDMNPSRHCSRRSTETSVARFHRSSDSPLRPPTR
jgi:hypothetical protein